MKFRKATIDDMHTLVEMIVEDALGSKRENYTLPLPRAYLEAFERIDSDQNQELTVVEDQAGQIIGVFQLTFIPYLT